MERAKLSRSISEAAFQTSYWYVTELRIFAREIGIKQTSKLRKDQLEELIITFIRTGLVTRIEQRPKVNAVRDSERGIHRSLPIVRYTNDGETKAFLYESLSRVDESLKPKSGAMYRLNRWRELKLQAGEAITYGDLADHYVKLCQHKGSFDKIPTGRYINFCAEFLTHEAGATHDAARRAWSVLKELPIDKTYAAWRVHTTDH